MDELQKWFLEHEDDGTADKSLEELLAGFGDDNYALASEGFNEFRKKVEKDNPWWKPVLRVTEHIAAALLIPVAAALFIFNRKPAQVQWSEVYTNSGQHRTVNLPDGSLIRLEPESHLMYPSAFSGDVRQVFLQGGAYADITHNPSRPFEIMSGDVKVKVFGTEFNFASYQTDQECELALVDGSVEMTIAGKNASHTIQMKTGELVHYDHRTGSVNKQRFSPAAFLDNNSRGALQFQNRKMEDIAHCLERQFDVRIIIDSKAVAEERFFASFINGEDLDTILDALNTSHHMRINKKGNVYTLSLK